MVRTICYIAMALAMLVALIFQLIELVHTNRAIEAEKKWREQMRKR